MPHSSDVQPPPKDLLDLHLPNAVPGNVESVAVVPVEPRCPPNPSRHSCSTSSVVTSVKGSRGILRREGETQDYTRSIQRDPTDAALFAERGKAYFALRKPDLALADFRSAVKLEAALKGTLGPLTADCEAAARPK